MPIIILEDYDNVPSCIDLYAEYLAAKALNPNLPSFEEWSANMVCHQGDA